MSFVLRLTLHVDCCAICCHFKRDTTLAPSIKFLFGPSGKLRHRIEAGERADIFTSALPTELRLSGIDNRRVSVLFMPTLPDSSAAEPVTP